MQTYLVKFILKKVLLVLHRSPLVLILSPRNPEAVNFRAVGFSYLKVILPWRHGRQCPTNMLCIRR